MIGNTFQFEWEVKLIEWCQTNIPSFLISMLEIVSVLGDVVFLVGVLAIMYLCIDKKAGRRIVINTIISFMFEGEIKNIFSRRRPYFDNPNIKCLKVVEKDYDMYDIGKQGFSFPSMHASNITVIFGTLYDYFRKNILLVITIVLAFLIGVSRFVLGCHYPTDVIAGWIFGLCAIIFVGKLQDKFSDKFIYLFGIIMGAIGCLFCTTAEFYTTYGLFIGFVFAEMFDKKYVNFKNTRNIVKMIARLALAAATFLAISNLLKLPFSSEVLESDTYISFMLRTIRYAVSMFATMGLTPMVYRYNILKLDDKM